MRPRCTTGYGRGATGAIDITDDTLATRVVDPSAYQLAIGDVSPHPEVTDLLVVAPMLDADAWLQCMEPGAGSCPDVPLARFGATVRR